MSGSKRSRAASAHDPMPTSGEGLAMHSRRRELTVLYNVTFTNPARFCPSPSFPVETAGTMLRRCSK